MPFDKDHIFLKETPKMHNDAEKLGKAMAVVTAIIIITGILLAMTTATTNAKENDKSQRFATFSNITLEINQLLADNDKEIGSLTNRDRMTIIVADGFNRLANIRVALNEIDPAKCFEEAYWATDYLLQTSLNTYGLFHIWNTQTIGTTASKEAAELIFGNQEFAADNYTKEYKTALDKCRLPTGYTPEPTNYGTPPGTTGVKSNPALDK